MKKRINHWYDQIFASMYDTLLAKTERETLSRLRSRLLEGVHGKVLDLGAGTGANIPYLEGSDLKVVFLDRSSPMILKGIQKMMRAKGLPVIASATALPFPDESFHCVVVTLVLCSVDDLSASFREVMRVLRQDGHLFVMEHVRASTPIMASFQKIASPFWQVLAGGCRLDRQTDREIRRLFSEEAAWVEKLGGIPFHMGRYRKRPDQGSQGQESPATH